MAIAIQRIGYGQVEPNHLSMQQTGQIYAQRPANKDLTQLENGQFVKYSVTADGVEEVTTSEDGIGEWMMVFNEIKLYGANIGEGLKDYAMKADDFVDKVMVPRVVKTNIGDLFTTNCFGAAGAFRTEQENAVTLSVGDTVTVGTDGFLKAGTGDIEFTVVKEYTMPDGTPGVKLQRTK